MASNHNEHMRLPRFALIGVPQHVIQRGNNRSPVFADPNDLTVYRRSLEVAAQKYGCEVHAYVLMTNHVHLLMTPSRTGSIGKVMQSIGRRYVQYFNGVHRRTGTLWEGRYKATVVESDRYLFSCYRYIELNPVRAGLVSRPEDYCWSSYRANALGLPDSLVSPHARYESLGMDRFIRQAAYRALFAEALDDTTMHRIRSATDGAWALGDEQFLRDLGVATSRRPRPLRVRRTPSRASGR